MAFNSNFKQPFLLVVSQMKQQKYNLHLTKLYRKSTHEGDT